MITYEEFYLVRVNSMSRKLVENNYIIAEIDINGSN